jgi:hypothetical protein
VSDSGGQNPEEYQRWSFRIGARQAIGPRGNLRLTYQFLQKNSNLATRSYTRNILSISYGYDF